MFHTIARNKNYEISRDGRVRVKKTGLVLKLGLMNGYRRVNLWRDRRPTSVLVHALVLETFRGPRPVGAVTRHLNGIKLDNRISNLRWGTHRENMRDKIRHGTNAAPRGEGHNRNKLTEEQIMRIRTMLKDGQRQKDIATCFGISQPAVSSIKRGVTWAWLKEEACYIP